MAHKKHHRGMETGHGVSEREGKAMGHGKFANMPTEVDMSQYPMPPMHGRHVLDDTISGIDRCNHHAERQTDKYVSNQH